MILVGEEHCLQAGALIFSKDEIGLKMKVSTILWNIRTAQAPHTNSSSSGIGGGGSRNSKDSSNHSNISATSRRTSAQPPILLNSLANLFAAENTFEVSLRKHMRHCIIRKGQVSCFGCRTMELS